MTSQFLSEIATLCVFLFPDHHSMQISLSSQVERNSCFNELVKCNDEKFPKKKNECVSKYVFSYFKKEK